MPPTPLRLIDYPNGESRATLLLAHGAGASMDTQFMNFVAKNLAISGWTIIRFEFPYMAKRRATGIKAPPDRPKILQDHFISEVSELDQSKPIIIGGKSMGGRIASLLVDQLAIDVHVRACICLGYPFHPIGRPLKLRTEHLEALQTPTLIVQGERDPMGNLHEVQHYPISDAIQFTWIKDGDHSFKPRKSSGLTEVGNLSMATEAVNSFLQSLL